MIQVITKKEKKSFVNMMSTNFSLSEHIKSQKSWKQM